MIPTENEMCDITNDNNLIQYVGGLEADEGGTLALWGLKSNEKISELAMKDVSYVHCGYDAVSYFIGFSNGDVKEYDNAKLED